MLKRQLKGKGPARAPSAKAAAEPVPSVRQAGGKLVHKLCAWLLSQLEGISEERSFASHVQLILPRAQRVAQGYGCRSWFA